MSTRPDVPSLVIGTAVVALGLLGLVGSTAGLDLSGIDLRWVGPVVLAVLAVAVLVVTTRRTGQRVVDADADADRRTA